MRLKIRTKMKKVRIGYIEQIGVGTWRFNFSRFRFEKDNRNILCISNQPSKWLLDIFTGYEQLGVIRVNKVKKFKEGEYVILIYHKNKIIDVQKINELDNIDGTKI